jgi:hypothetical protein
MAKIVKGAIIIAYLRTGGTPLTLYCTFFWYHMPAHFQGMQIRHLRQVMA